ncbi:hypothetical protein GGR57DRAFT_499551 [Xylariaceae sp. FL1272]|nr:hypothetical protein GGR57DRAFT_499551 [Xylariaceae sp. FL1272]
MANAHSTLRPTVPEGLPHHTVRLAPPNAQVGSGPFLSEADPNVKFIFRTTEEAKHHAKLLCEPDASGPKVVLSVDASSDSPGPNAGVGLVLLRLNGPSECPEWNVETFRRYSFAVIDNVDSNGVEVLGLYCALLRAYSELVNWIRMMAKKGLELNSRPRIRIISDSKTALRYLRKKYHQHHIAERSELLPENFRARLLEPLLGLAFYGCDIEFHWLKGHSQDPSNTLADKLANIGRLWAMWIPRGVGDPSGNAIFSLTTMIYRDVLENEGRLSRGCYVDVNDPAQVDLAFLDRNNRHTLNRLMAQLSARIRHLIATGEIMVYPFAPTRRGEKRQLPREDDDTDLNGESGEDGPKRERKAKKKRWSRKDKSRQNFTPHTREEEQDHDVDDDAEAEESDEVDVDAKKKKRKKRAKKRAARKKSRSAEVTNTN